VFSVNPLADLLPGDGSGKTRPSSARIELIERAEKRLTRHDINVNAGVLFIPELILKRGLGPVALSDVVLLWREEFPKFILRGLRFSVGRIVGHGGGAEIVGAVMNKRTRKRRDQRGQERSWICDGVVRDNAIAVEEKQEHHERQTAVLQRKATSL
jgi:hypothetical protein